MLHSRVLIVMILGLVLAGCSGGAALPQVLDPPGAGRIVAQPTPHALGSDTPIIAPSEATNAAVSIALSNAAYPDGSAAAALLASDDSWAYAIATGGSQGAVEGPLLLTSRSELSPGVLDEIERVGADRVYLLGDVSELEPAITEQLNAAGIAVDRIGGPDHIANSMEAARRLIPGATTALVLGGRDLPNDLGRGYVDALAAGAWAAANDIPILLTDPFELSGVTREYISRSSIQRVMVVGGQVAISARVSDQLEQLGVAVERIEGANRFETAAKISQRWAGDHNGFLLIDGNSDRLWAAGFAAAAYAVRANAPVLLANNGSLPPETDVMLKGRGMPVQLICAPGVNDYACLTAREIALARDVG